MRDRDPSREAFSVGRPWIDFLDVTVFDQKSTGCDPLSRHFCRLTRRLPSALFLSGRACYRYQGIENLMRLSRLYGPRSAKGVKDGDPGVPVAQSIAWWC
jgi:hypothetical protein